MTQCDTVAIGHLLQFTGIEEHGTESAYTRITMTNPTNTKPARIDHLSARIALQSAQHHAVRTVRRVSAVDTSAADPGVASRMRWARAVLAAATTGKATEI